MNIKPPTKQTERLTIRLSEEMKKLLYEVARKYKVSVGELLRQLIEEHLIK
jgi:predicted HicB family RNase H-like nuclease